MTDRENIRAYIEKLHKEHRGSEGDSIFRRALRTVLFYIDSMQEEPSEIKSKCMYTNDNYTDEDRKVICEGCEEQCGFSKKTINDKLGGINNALVQDRLITSKPIGVPADAIELVSIPDKKEVVSDGCIYNRTLKERQHSCKYCSAACQARIEEPSIPDIVDEHYWEKLGEELVSEKDKLRALSDGKQHLGWLDDVNSLEEPVSEDLEKAAHQCYEANDTFMDGFKKGANWQKDKMTDLLEAEKEKTLIGLNEWENGIEHGRMKVINSLTDKLKVL